jgi:2'-hydroxyisoflavone reductase
LNVLILGGTRFLGRATAEALLARGHRVALFHRGQTLPDGLPGAENVIADRAQGLEPLAGRRWDAAVDMWGTVPSVAAAAASALASHVERYWYVSSLSVYRDDAPPPIRESSPLVDVPDVLPREVTMEAYGAQKVASERAVLESFGERATIVRPGLIVGPHDRSDRFTYWVRRIARGDTILAPDRPERRMQFIDVRDLGDWIASGLERGLSGIYNATGPALKVGDVLDVCAKVAGKVPTFVWIPEKWLLREGVGPWMELPLWAPAGDDVVVSAADCSRAVERGLVFRPLAETVRDTLEWDGTRPPGESLKAGLSAEKERRLLDAWNAASSGGAR